MVCCAAVVDAIVALNTTADIGVTAGSDTTAAGVAAALTTIAVPLPLLSRPAFTTAAFTIGVFRARMRSSIS